MEETVHVHKETKQKSSSWFSLEQISLYVFSGLLFLLPLFFIPITGVSVQFSKFLLVVLAVLVVGGIWVLQRLKDGTFELPVNMLSLASVGVFGVMVISALTSGGVYNSFIGQGFETDTVAFFGFAFLLLFLIPGVFSTKRQMLNAYGVFLGCLVFLGLIHLVRLAFPTLLSFGVLMYTTDTLIGKWNDLAIFFGLGALLSLITLESLPLNRVMKGIIYAVLVVSVFFLAVINFSLIWFVLGGLSLVLFVYGIVMGRTGHKSTGKISLPIAPCIVLIISVIFIFAGGRIGNTLANQLNVSQAEVRPTWQGTIDIAKEVIVQKSVVRPLFGVGPNQFEQAWLLNKPGSVNNTVFWNTNFNYGVGIIPSALVTTGLLGFISWVIFLGMLIYMGFRSILSKIADATSQYLIVSSFIGAIYLWLFTIVYVPSLAVLILAFIFTGLFISGLTMAGILHPVKIEYFKNPKIGFVSVFILIVLLIAGIGIGYLFITKLVAASYYQKAIIEINKGEFVKSENFLRQAIDYSPNDVYYRGLSQAYLVHLNSIIASANATTPSEGLQSQFSALSNGALQAGQAAVNYDTRNYRNYSALGDVWTSLVPYGVANSYENAVAAYNKVLELNPQSPTVYLQLARVESAHNDVPKAKNYIEQAVKMKYNYTDAYYLLAQIQIAQDDVKSAINSVTAAALSDGNNPGLFYQLGLLYYSEKDYKNASAAFAEAVRISPNYSNALYYLGLSLYELDRTTDAIAAFEKVQTLNPESEDVTTIIKNLKAGKSPFPKTAVPAVEDTKKED